MVKTQQEPVEPISPEAPVESGLQPEAQAEASPVNDAPINIAGIAEDVGRTAAKFEMVLSDTRPEGFVDPVAEEPKTPPPTNYRDSEVLRKEKERETIKGAALREQIVSQLRHNIKQARAPELPKPQPVSPHIAEQTRLEMEAGRKANEHHASARSIPPRRIDPPRNVVEPSTVPVLRPADFVPKMDKSPISRSTAGQSHNL